TLRGTFRPLLTNPGVALVIEDPGTLPPFHTDEGKLCQILRNLVANALKFTEAGEVRVRAALDGEHPGMALFTVSDTGIGIAPADHSRIFQEFSQLRGPLQDKHHGSGLGLPLARRLAVLLGGTLTLESEPGRGSTFLLRIPLSLGERAPAPALPEMAADAR